MVSRKHLKSRQNVWVILFEVGDKVFIRRYGSSEKWMRGVGKSTL